MTRQPRTRANASKNGLLLALGVGGALVLSIAGVAVFNSLRAAPAAAPAPAQEPTALTVAPDASALSPTGPGASAHGAEFFAQLFDRSDPTRIEADIRADRSRPLDARTQELTRPVAWVALRDGRLIYAKAQRGQVRLSRDSRAASLETGELEGDVLVLIFAAGVKNPDPEATPALARLTTDALTIDWSQGELRVPHTLLAQLDQIRFEGSDVTARFDPLSNSLLFAHVASTKRLSIAPRSVRALQNEGQTQAQNQAQNPNQSQAQNQTPAQPQATPETPSLLRTEDLFRLTASGSVRVQQGDRSLSAPQLSAWLRLMDGALPRPLATASTAEPSGQGGPATSEPGATPIAPPARPDQAPATSTAIASSASPDAQDAPVEARWTGPLEVRRLPTAPDELASDDLFLAASSDDASTRVTLADDAAGLTAHGDRVQVAGTRGEFTLTRAGDAAPLSQLLVRDLGSMDAASLRINLPANMAQVTGQGTLTLTRNDAGAAPLDGLLGQPSAPTPAVAATPQAGTISWSRGAEFTFVHATAAGSASDSRSKRSLPTALSKAQFVGDVRAENEQAIIEGDTLITQFAPPAPSAGSSAAAPRISDVWVQGQAAIRAKPTQSSDQPGWLRAQLVYATFTAGPTGRPQARTLTASGQVRVEQQSQSIRSDELAITFVDEAAAKAQLPLAARAGESTDAAADTSLAQAPGQSSPQNPAPEATLALGSIARIEATGNVDVQSPRDGLLARGHALVALPAQRQYVLTSEAADQAYAPVLAIKDGSSIRAPRIAIDASTNMLRAEGLGTVAYGLDSIAEGLPADGPAALGSFTKFFEVRQNEGIAMLDGQARVHTSTASAQLQTLEAPRLTLRFAPAAAPSSTSASATAPAGLTAQVQTIEAIGDPADPRSVRLALRTLATPCQACSPRELVQLEPEQLAAQPASQLLAVASSAMRANVPAGTIDIDAPGTLRVADLQREGGAASTPEPTLEASPEALAEASGNLASFRWSGSLRLRQDASSPQPAQASTQPESAARPTVTAQMEGDVRMVRVEATALSDDPAIAQTAPRTELTCEQLIAQFGASAQLNLQQGQQQAESADQLRSVQALRSVWVRSQGRELTCSALAFDPQQSQIDATGEANLPVALSNPGGTPLLAQRVLWNTRTGRVDVLQPIVTAAP
jgi:hypothetical protein